MMGRVQQPLVAQSTFKYFKSQNFSISVLLLLHYKSTMILESISTFQNSLPTSVKSIVLLVRIAILVCKSVEYKVLKTLKYLIVYQ